MLVPAAAHKHCGVPGQPQRVAESWLPCQYQACSSDRTGPSRTGNMEVGHIAADIAILCVAC